MNQLEARLEDVKTPLNVAVIGCVVNGPGEAKEADLGFTGETRRSLTIHGRETNSDFPWVRFSR